MSTFTNVKLWGWVQCSRGRVVMGFSFCARADLYTVPQKTVQNCFCHKFVKCLPNLIIFGTRIAQRIGLREVHSFSTSPN